MAKKTKTDNVDDLNRIWIPISSLKLELAKLEKGRDTHIPLGDLLLAIRNIYRSTQ